MRVGVMRLGSMLPSDCPTFLWEVGSRAAENEDGRGVRGLEGRGGTCQLLGARQPAWTELTVEPQLRWGHLP